MCHTYINKTLLLKSLQSYGINASAIKFQEFRGWQGWEAGIASLVLSLTCSVSQDTSPRFLYLIPDIFPALPIEITQSLRISEAPVGLKIPVHKIISKYTYHYRCVCSLLQQRDKSKERERCSCPSIVGQGDIQSHLLNPSPVITVLGRAVIQSISLQYLTDTKRHRSNFSRWSALGGKICFVPTKHFL